MRYKPKACEGSFRATSHAIRKILPENLSGRLLDIGCYKGYLRDLLPSKVEYVGLDVDARHFNSVVCDLNNKRIPFGDEQFDWVIASNVLEHLFYPEEILDEIHRILKTDGTAIISLPNDHGLISRLFSPQTGLFRKHIPYEDQIHSHHWVFSLKTARQFVSKRFKITNEYYHNGHILSKFNFILKYFPGTCSDFYMKVRRRGVNS